jgi:hypothetical protein
MTDPGATPSETSSVHPSLRTDYIQPTLGYALRIWWALYWRTTAISLVLIGLTTLALRAMYQAALLSPSIVIWASKLSPYILTYAAVIPVMRFVLHKRFSSFRIALWSHDGQISAPDEKPSWDRTIRIWWTYSWRTLIYSLVGTVVVGYPMGMMLGIVAPSPAVMKAFGMALGFVVGAAMGLFVIYSRILDENIGDFRVALLATEATEPTANEAVPTSAA